jgi:hypothetical protein
MFIKDTCVQEMASRIEAHANGKTSILAMGEHSKISVEELIAELNKRQLKFIGAIFPKVIHEDHIYDSGIVQNTFADVIMTFAVQNLPKGDFAFPQTSLDPDKAYTLLTYVDGLTPNKTEFLVGLYNRFGAGVKYLGGGAGSLSLVQQPCVFTMDGIFQDSAVCCLIEQNVALSVRHGWKKIAGPIIATKTKGNIIEELNWQNAYEVYAEQVEKYGKTSFENAAFFDVAKGHPFGIVREHTERVVRDPLSINEKGHIICVGEVEENTFLDILEGNKEDLVSAAKSAVEDCLIQCPDPSKAIIIDCISRVLFMGDDFQEEIREVIAPLKAKNPNVSVGGALTLGEISSFGDGLIQFFNKTVVIGLF